MVGIQKDMSGWFLARDVCINTAPTSDIGWHRKLRFFSFQPDWTCESCIVHLFISMSVSVCCVLNCASKCGSVLFHPPLVVTQLLTTEGKVKVLQTKRQNVLTRASSDKGTGECGLRQGCTESRCTITAWLKWTNLASWPTLLFYFLYFISSFLLHSHSVFFFLLFFFRGQRELIFFHPPLLLFNTPLPLPAPLSSNQYSICMLTGIKYKHTLYNAVTVGGWCFSNQRPFVCSSFYLSSIVLLLYYIHFMCLFCFLASLFAQWGYNAERWES